MRVGVLPNARSCLAASGYPFGVIAHLLPLQGRSGTLAASTGS